MMKLRLTDPHHPIRTSTTVLGFILYLSAGAGENYCGEGPQDKVRPRLNDCGEPMLKRLGTGDVLPAVQFGLQSLA